MLSEIPERNRRAGPLVHCVSNDVTANAGYRNYIIDAMFRLDGTALKEGANDEIL